MKNSTVSHKLNGTNHPEYQWAVSLLLDTSGLNPENARHQRKYQRTQEKENGRSNLTLCSYETVLVFSSFELPPTTFREERECSMLLPFSGQDSSTPFR